MLTLRKSLLLALLLAVSPAGWAQSQTEHLLDAKVERVTLFLDGAEISHTHTLDLKPGRNLLVFSGISPRMDARSIRLTANPAVSVLSISSRTDYLNQAQSSPRVRQVKDSLEMTLRKITALNDEVGAYALEKDVLVKNTQLGGQGDGLTATQIREVADFYRSRSLEINRKLSELRVELEKQAELKGRLERQLQDLNASLNQERAEVTVLLSVEQALRGPVELRYLVSQAGWTPAYDIRVQDVNQEIELEYRAKVYNNTGIDWNGVRFKLSTGDPNKTAASPDLRPWYLSYAQSNYSNSRFEQAQGYMNSMLMDEMVVSTNVPGTGEGVTFREVLVTELSAEFDIATPYTVPADNKPYLVDVVEHKLPASFKHYAVPKLDRDAFLLAQITGWEELNLVEGPASIYFAGTYVGQSYIQTRDVRDTLDLSLGRDGRVLVTRTKLREFSSERVIGGKTTETHAYEIVVKNNRDVPISLSLLDQVPISQDSEIEVQVLEISGAKHNLTTGQLDWQVDLQPGASRSFRLTFAVKYPKNTTIEFERNEVRRMRSY